VINDRQLTTSIEPPASGIQPSATSGSTETSTSVRLSAHAEVSVESLVEVDRVFIALGSNLGERAYGLQMAREKLAASAATALIKASTIYETDPVGKIDQPAFLNQVVEMRTTLSPEDLLSRLLQIEQELGRERQERWGPRSIDLDLLAYGRRQAQTPRLNLPHPELHRRRFVLAPWAEIAPEFELVGLNATVEELLQQCDDRSRIQKLKT
jgi:2-amino-4-hydroxy-6-hydroxymethyldihydropteridine diphosphokinase